MNLNSFNRNIDETYLPSYLNLSSRSDRENRHVKTECLICSLEDKYHTSL